MFSCGMHGVGSTALNCHRTEQKNTFGKAPSRIRDLLETLGKRETQKEEHLNAWIFTKNPLVPMATEDPAQILSLTIVFHYCKASCVIGIHYSRL